MKKRNGKLLDIIVRQTTGESWSRYDEGAMLRGPLGKRSEQSEESSGR
jgi:hypothetical protein